MDEKKDNERVVHKEHFTILHFYIKNHFIPRLGFQLITITKFKPEFYN